MRLRTWVYVCAAALLCIPATAFGVTRGEALSLAKEIGGAVGDDFDVVFPTEYTASAWSGGYSIQPRGYYDIANGEPDAKHAAVLLQLITNEIIGPNEIRRLGMILSNMGTDAALPAADLLGDGREKVRWAGATVLSIMGSHATPALSALQSRLADSNETARVRVMAARAIAEITGEDVFALHATVPGIDDLLQAEVTQSIEDTNSDAVWQAYLAGTLEETFTPRGFYYYNGGNVDSYRAFYQLATGTDLEEANQYVRENISGTYNQFTGAKATDRNISTDSRWQPTGAAESMTFDYGQVVTFNTARIHFYKSDLLTADFELQVSTDGVNFEPALAETTSSINPEGECETFTFPDKDGRYLRCVYYSNSENNNNLNGVIELVAYGPAGTELEPPTFTDVTASDNDWVWRGNPDTPQPEAEELWVKNQETDGSARFTFLRFDVSSLPEGVIGSSMLELYFKESVNSNDKLEVHLLPDGIAETTWGSDLTWNTRPPADQIMGTYNLDVASESGSVISVSLSDLAGAIENDTNGQITLRLSANNSGALKFASLGNTLGHPGPSLKVEFQSSPPVAATETSFADSVEGTGQLAEPLLGLFSSTSRHYPGRLDEDLEWTMKEFYFREINSKNELTVADSEEQLKWEDWLHVISTHNISIRQDTSPYNRLIWLYEDPAFTGRTFRNGDTVAERYEAATRMLSEGFKLLSLHGLHNELGSDQYNERSHRAIYQLLDYAVDPVLRQRITMWHDIFLTDYAQMSLNGLRGGSKERPKDGGLNDRLNGFLSFLNGEWGTMHELPGFNGYRLPEPALLLRWLGPTEPSYVMRNRLPGEKESVGSQTKGKLKSSTFNYAYRTPEYITGCGMVDFKQGGWGQWCGVNFKNLGSIYMRAWDDNGDRWYAQDKDVMIAQRYPGAFYNGDGGLYFTPTLEKVERDGWVFARTPDGNAYAAVRFVSGTSYWNEPARFKLLPDPNDYYSPVILQAGRKIDYASFEDFQDAILAAPLTVTAEKVDYTGPNSKRIEFFRGDDPFVAPKIDGEPINFEYDFNYRSPFIQNEGESDRVTLRYGRKLWIYDLENNTITETEAAPAPVSAAASESETGYGPENAIDGDLTPASHWSAPGAAQSITIDYGQSQTFTEVDIAWLSSDSRAADFELQVSSDGVIFTPALGLSTSSLTAEGDYESFDLPMVSGRYLRYIGMGNSVDDGNQVIEIRAYGFRDGQDPVVEPTPISTERLLTPLSVSASSELTPNYAKEKAFDFDMNRESRWSALGDSQSITYEYPFPMLIDRVDIAWLSSDERSTEFELQISDFGNEWTTVYGRAASSIHPEAAVEAYAITPTSGRFLRCIAYGNSENDWNHIIEMHAYGELDTSPPFAAGGLELWLDAEDLDGDFFTEGSAESGLSGTVVELWKDKSGNGRDAIGVDGKSGLNLADGALNGRAVVRSSGDDQLDIGGSAFAVQTVIAVVDASQEPFNSFRRIMRSPTGGLDSAVVNALLVNGTNGTSIFSTLPETGAEDVNLIIDGVDTNVADNSETFGSPHSQHRIVVVGAGAATRSVADWYISEEDTGNHWLGDIAELIVYNRALSPAEIEEVGTYLEVKWGIQSAYGTFEVSTLNPLDGALGVSIDADLALSFNEDVQAGSGDITIRRVSDDSVVEVIAVSTGQVSIDGKTVTINPAGNLDYFTDYYVEVANGALEDLNGADFSGFTGDTTWQFKTEYEPGLVWHSRLDGDAVDTVGTVDGTLNGNTTATADRFGDAASALLFDGDGDNVIIDKTTLPASFSAGTISVWVQADPADTQTDDGFIGVGGTGGGNDQFFALQVNGDRYRADFDRGGSGATGRLDALTASEIDSNWHHVIATFDAAAQDSLRLYVDGVPVDSENISSASLMIPTNNWTVGSSRTSERYWPGRVDDAGVWNKALTADEVKSLHDLTASSDLKYSASEFEQLRRIHAAGSGNVIIGDLEWTYATSLTPAAGLSGSSASGFTLVFDAAADTGLESAPASASVSLSVLSDGNGMIASSVNGAHAVGTTVEVDPIPNTYYSWGNWSGDVPGGQVNDDPLQLLMDQDRTITANFTADLAVNDVPHWWLAQYGWTSDFDAFAVLDDDGDSLFAWEEYLAGTNPTDANSVFKVLSTEMVPESGDLVMTWPSVAGQDYYILQSWDLKAWWRVSDAIAATPPINTYTQVIDSDPVAFYRVAINPPASLMVDFSSTQGYSNGSLNGQPSNGLTWSENGLGTYQVDAAAGTVTIDSNDASFRTAQLDVTIGAATTATLVTEFTITAGTVQPVSTVPFLRSDLITQTNGLAFVTMRQLNSGENNWELQFFESSDASSFFNTSTIGGAEIGLLVSGGSFTDDESDGLRMTARCTLTDGQTQWEAEIKLENLETGAVIRTVTGQWEATNGFRDADKFFRLSTGAINNYGDGGGTQVDIHRVIFTE